MKNRLKNIELVFGPVEEEEKAKEGTQNTKPVGVKKPAHTVVVGATSGDAECVSEHEPI